MALGHDRPGAEAATSGATLISWAPAPEPTHGGILHRPGGTAQVAQLLRRPTLRGLRRAWRLLLGTGARWANIQVPTCQARAKAPPSLPEIRPMRNPAGHREAARRQTFRSAIDASRQPVGLAPAATVAHNPCPLETFKAHFPGFALHSDGAATGHILRPGQQTASMGRTCWWGYFLSKSG